MASGECLSVTDIFPLQIDGREIEMVDNFTYLGHDGEISEVGFPCYWFV